MKPAFALDFRDDTLSLLHRSGGGWQLVGAVPLDTPDLPEALNYLRSTALALSPKGISTKLIVPNDQILYTWIHAPGPSEAERLTQVTKGLEGRTPYDVADLAFDYSGDGPEVLVAVIAKETLAEAEAFANEYRFNPLSFVAAPDGTDYVGEPWFGLTANAVTALGSKKLERDSEAVAIIARDLDAAAIGKPVETPPEPATVEPVAELAPEISEPVKPEEKPAEPAPEAVSEPEPEPELEPELEPEPAPEPEPAIPAPSPNLIDPPRPAPPSIDERDDSEIAARLGAALAKPIPQPERPPAMPPVPSFDHIDVAEAPMALDVPAEDGLDDEPQGANAVKAALSAQSARVTDVTIEDEPTPAPSNAALMAFNTRRQDDATGKTPSLGAPPPQRGSKPAAPPVRPAAKPAKASALRGVGALVGGAANPKRQKVEMPRASINAAATLDVAQTNPAAPARKPLAKGPGGFALREPVRGKPRYLGLILTVVLLFLLAMIAAWSSMTLTQNNKATPDPVQAASLDTATPDVTDEMLADMQDPEALADGQGEATAAVEPPVETALGDPGIAAPEPVAAEPVAAEPALEPAANAPHTDGAAAIAQVSTNLGDGTQDEIFLASMDAPPTAPDPLSLPPAEARGDPLPAAQAAPPPFGTVYQFEANGTIRPTPEGIITPEGVMLRAGKPPVVPAERPEAVTAAAAEVAPATSLAEPAAAPQVFADPALAGKLPKPRPASLVPPAPAEQGSLAPAADSRFASLRPKARSQTVLAAGETARQASAAATLSAEAAAPAPETSGSPLAIAISRKPAPRPRDMSRAVDAALAVAMKQPAPQPQADPEPEPQKTAAAASNAAIKVKPAVPEDDGEPDVAASNKKTPLKTTVAKQATFKNAINLSKINLIGVYGTQSNRYALVRQSNGRYKKVKVGDSIDGGRVAAITGNEVRYQKGGRLISLAMPSG